MTSKTILKNNYILWFLISIVFTTIIINQSLRQGQLALPPTYDDIIYFNDALTRLNILYNNGFNALLSNFIQNPPHSPLATIIPFIGFSLFGANNWAPPIINGIFVFFLLVFLDKISPNVPKLGKLIIAFISLTWPITGHLVIECRPDLVWSLSTACFTILCLQESTRITRTNKTQMIIGGLIGFALLAKPSIFPITLLAALGSLFIASITDLYLLNLWHQKRIVIIANLRCLAVAALIASPYYVLAYKKVYAYIYDVVFSSNASMWDPNSNLSLADHLLYYLSATSGQMMMGNWLYAWVFLALISLAFILINKDWNKLVRVLPLIGGFLVLYALVTLPKLKMNFFGGSLYFFILITSIKMSVDIFKTFKFKIYQRHYRFGYIVILILLLFGLNQFQWPWYNLRKQSEVLSSEIQYRKEMIESLYNEIVSSQKLNRVENIEPIKVFFTATNSYFNANTLDFYFKKNNVKSLTTDLYLSDDLGLYSKSIEMSDYIVSFSVDNTDTIAWVPSKKIGKRVAEMLDSNKNLKLMKTYSNPYNKNKAQLYINKEAFCQGAQRTESDSLEWTNESSDTYACLEIAATPINYKGVTGLFPLEKYERRPLRWTNGNAEIPIVIGEGVPPKSLTLKIWNLRVSESPQLEITANDVPIFKGRLDFKDRVLLNGLKLSLKLPPLDDQKSLVIKINNEPFQSAGDNRKLGIAIESLQLSGIDRTLATP
jgi:hypothetical protein